MEEEHETQKEINGGSNRGIKNQRDGRKHRKGEKGG